MPPALWAGSVPTPAAVSGRVAMPTAAPTRTVVTEVGGDGGQKRTDTEDNHDGDQFDD
ncbi:hypothetical protein AB4Z39_07520 [Mycobacterium adipatum]|uniref:hypothetical protein n=1 Tax=Mycobacterium adipatum TaxID=1682113 RepID=UPI0034E0AC2A